jgi:hypothetical protein
MSKRELRAERDRVAALLRDAPPDRTRLLAHTTEQRQRAEQGLTNATAREEAAGGRRRAAAHNLPATSTVR